MLKKKIIYIVIILLLTFIMLFQPVRNIIRRVSSDFFYPFFSLVLKIENIIEKKNLARKDKAVLVINVLELEKTNNKLYAKCSKLESVVNENNKLRKLLGLKINPEYEYIFAEIIYRDPIEWFNSFTINKGESSGIQNGSIVLAGTINGSLMEQSQFGVIGRVETVSKHTAAINTIISRKCKLSVKIPENGAAGILTGGERNGNKFWSNISYLPRDLIYKPSSAVVTSGMNDLTPANLMIGHIMKEGSGNIITYNNLFAEARIKPIVDMTNLKFILVLVKKK